MRLLSLCALVLALSAATHATSLSTPSGLTLFADLPGSLSDLRIDGEPVSRATGGLFLIDPRTGGPPPADAFALTAQAQVQGERVVISGMLRAAGDQETVCMLQARIPVGGEGWLFWDDMTRARPLKPGEGFVQSVYPVCCVTDPDKRLGLAVGIDPDPMQPALASYDLATQCIIVNWFLGFTPLARPELRMQAPFKMELYRVLPKWGFRSALDGYYRAHPAQFDWRAKFEGLWLFASASESLPNPQHYAYNEGGPPPTPDIARGIATFPYTCTGDLIVPLPVEWGIAKTHEDMLDRLARWEQMPRLDDWEQLSAYEIDKAVAHSGERSLKFHTGEKPEMLEVRRVFDLSQKQVDPVTVTVWTKAQDVTGPEDANYGLWLDLVMADGTNQFGKVAPAAVGTHDWQQLTVTVGTDQPIARVNAYLLFRNTHSGTAWFDDFSLTTASAPDRNLSRNSSFEDMGPPPQAQYLRDNVMYDEQDHMRWFADTWGGADVGPASPINWIRYTLLVNPDQVNPDGRPTAGSTDLAKYAAWFDQFPQCAGGYLDGTSGCCTVTWDYRRDHFYCFSDPFEYRGTAFRPCASGKASHIRWVQEFKRRFPGKLAFGNVWASNAMFPMCMALDVLGYESSKWYDLAYADYYRAAAYHKPGLYLNYFRIGQQLDTREGGERFFRYATAYGIFPSIGRFTDEAYEKFGDLQHLYIPIVKRLFRAGWEPVTWAEADDEAVRVQRFGGGPDTSPSASQPPRSPAPPVHFTVLNPTDVPREVKLSIDLKALGLDGKALEAVEMGSSASLAFTQDGSILSTRVALGPQDVAVVTLLPWGGLGAWYRERAAEILQGAAYVYAQTPPTVQVAELAKRLRTVNEDAGAPAVAQAVDAIRTDIARLQAEGQKLPDDLKRRSYLRELDEAERLLRESLLADIGARIGWAEGRVAPVDAAAMVETRTLTTRGSVRPAVLRAWPGRLVELPEGEGAMALTSRDGQVRCPPERAVTVAAELEFTDAAGNVASVTRRGYAFFGPVCELRAEGEAGSDALSVHLRNCDVKPRRFRLELTAPAGLTVTPAAADAELQPGAGHDLRARVVFPASTKSGTYSITVKALTEAGTVAEEVQTPVVYVIPLAPGDLALATAGATVAVDSAYYAYNEKPLNDGVVLPLNVPFNEAAWASAEGAEEHWVELQWPTPQTVGRAVVYWNVENGVVWTSRHLLVQVREAEGWKTVAEMKPEGPEPVTEGVFAPVQTTALRLLQPKDRGPATRPKIMWLREVAVY